MIHLQYTPQYPPRDYEASRWPSAARRTCLPSFPTQLDQLDDAAAVGAGVGGTVAVAVGVKNWLHAAARAAQTLR